MSAHTPGPWTWHGETDGEPGVMFGDWSVARPVLGPDAEPVVWALWVERDRELYFGFYNKADANLIAAAPDLLEAVKSLLAAEQRLGDLCDGNCRPGVSQHTETCAVGAALAAIAKAEGKS